MADLDLDEIERLADAATPGPWGVEPDRNSLDDLVMAKIGLVAATAREDAAFIAAARTAVPALSAEVRRLREAEGCQRRMVIELRKMVERRNARLRATAVPVPCAEKEQRHWHHVAIRFDKAPSASMMGEAIGAAEAYITALCSQIQAHESCAMEARREIEALRDENAQLKADMAKEKG